MKYRIKVYRIVAGLRQLHAWFSLWFYDAHGSDVCSFTDQTAAWTQQILPDHSFQQNMSDYPPQLWSLPAGTSAQACRSRRRLIQKLARSGGKPTEKQIIKHWAVCSSCKDVRHVHALGELRWFRSILCHHKPHPCFVGSLNKNYNEANVKVL